jgi:adenosylcobinamide-phosphate synthase
VRTGPAILAGYGADLLLGDPRRAHPVALFGGIAHALEARVYRSLRRTGAGYVAGLVGLAVASTLLLERLASRLRHGRASLIAACLWAALGGRSLTREGMRLREALDAGDLAAARERLPALVGRDPSALDAAEICRASIESIAENTGDAVVGPLVWCAIGGATGAVGYRAINTLDAMVGHRSERYERFGWAAARLDDLVSWPGATLTALLTVALAPAAGGSPARSWRVLRRDGRRHPSPNAGRLEAAFAGALDVRLGGRNVYGDRVEERPQLGDGRTPEPSDLARAARLSVLVGAAAAMITAALTWRERS